MPATVRTEHSTDDRGRNVTVHTVVLEDATGQTHEYPFEATGSGHEYVGDDEPTDRPRAAISAWEEADSQSEFTAAVQDGLDVEGAA